MRDARRLAHAPETGCSTPAPGPNRPAQLLLADFPPEPARERNASRWMVLDEGARSLFGDDWEQVASDHLRDERVWRRATW